MSKNTKPLSIIFFILALVIVLFLTAPAWSDDKKHHNNSSGDVSVDASNIVKGDSASSLALGQSLGDVDLGRATDCVVTKQFGIIIYQRQSFGYDPYCIARDLDQQGKYEAAAKMRCTDKETAKLYGEDCLSVMNYKPREQTTTHVEESTEYHQDLQAQIVELQAQIEEAPAPVQTTTSRYVQQPLLNESQRSKLQAILDEDDEDE